MEILDIVDKEGRPTGQTIERNEAHRIGAWHRCASVWIIRQKAGIYTRDLLKFSQL